VGVEWAGEVGSLVCPPKKNLTTIGVSETIRHHFQTLDTEGLKQMDREDEVFKGTAPCVDKVCCLYLILNYSISLFPEIVCNPRTPLQTFIADTPQYLCWTIRRKSPPNAATPAPPHSSRLWIALIIKFMPYGASR
jgi:hypothetical protein